jgi:6-phosphogluconolactonase (cycloisomerase 2 family)
MTSFSPELVQRINTGGRTPRCLAMAECGEFLLVAHQHSHDVASFRRNSEDGTLSFINRIDANCAACVKLVRSELVRHGS